MGRTLRSTIPQLQTHFVPQLPNQTELTEKEQKAKQHQKKNFDRRHKSRNLKPLKEGETVWMSDRKESGTVIRKVAPRSYLVQTTEGEYRRNRKCLIPLSVTAPTVNIGLPDEEPRPVADTSKDTSMSGTTRSGRQSKPPDRLIEQM